MQPLTAVQPGRIELIRLEAEGDAPVGQHRAPPVRRGDRDDRAGGTFRQGPADFDAATLQFPREELSNGIRGAARDESRRTAEGDDPRGHVRGLAAGPDAGLTVGIRVLLDRPVERHDHVEEDVAEGADHRGNLHLRRGRGSTPRHFSLVPAGRARRQRGRPGRCGPDEDETAAGQAADSHRARGLRAGPLLRGARRA